MMLQLKLSLYRKMLDFTTWYMWKVQDVNDDLTNIVYDLDKKMEKKGKTGALEADIIEMYRRKEENETRQ